jgi:hypothetical protein
LRAVASIFVLAASSPEDTAAEDAGGALANGLRRDFISATFPGSPPVFFQLGCQHEDMEKHAGAAAAREAQCAQVEQAASRSSIVDVEISQCQAQAHEARVQRSGEASAPTN